MSNYLLRTLAQAEGYCCEITYLALFDTWENREIAEHIGVHRKTIQRTRTKIRRGQLTCPGACKNLTLYYTLCLRRGEKVVRDPSYRKPSYITDAQAIDHYAREEWITHFRKYAEEKTDEDPGYLRALSAYRILAKPHPRVPSHPDAGTARASSHSSASDADSSGDPAA